MVNERAVIEWAKKVVALDGELNECNRALENAKYEAWKWDWIEFPKKHAGFDVVRKVLGIDETRMGAMLFHLLHDQLENHKMGLIIEMTTLLNHDLNTARTERE